MIYYLYIYIFVPSILIPCDPTRHGNRLSGVAEVPEGGFPLELRHRQACPSADSERNLGGKHPAILMILSFTRKKIDEDSPKFSPKLTKIKKELPRLTHFLTYS